jgi:hypothetical protein
MLTPQVPVNSAGLDVERPASRVRTHEQVSWGLGWGLQQAPAGEAPAGKAFWHWGDNGVFHAFVMGFVELKRGLVCMANCTSGQALWADLFGLAFGGAQPAIVWLSSLRDDRESGE